MKIKLPDNFMGISTAEALERALEEKVQEQTIPIETKSSVNLDGYIYVPTISLYVSRERAFQDKNWFDVHKELKKEGCRMLNLFEYIKFLEHVRTNNPDIYEDITAVRKPTRGEWIDAFFEQRKDEMYVLTDNKTKSEKLDSYLSNDKTPGIDLESWIKSPTKQGLPKSNIKDGSLYYWAPENGCVARFYADSDRANLGCGRDPRGSYGWLGVRRAKN